MKDYKNVKVPRKYRSDGNRVTVKRVTAARSSPKRRAGFGGALVKGLAAAVIVLGSYLGWAAYQSLVRAEVFQIAGVDVRGVRQISEGEIKDMAAGFTGQNIFRVDLHEAARRARAHPWVKDVRIERRLPNRISMVFTERSPAAVLETGTGRFLVDDEGVVVGKAAREGARPSSLSLASLPLVKVKNCPVRAGDRVDNEGVAEALALLAELAACRGWRLEEVTVNANTPESLSLLYAGREFKIGRGNYAEKLRRLGEIMADVKRRGITFAYVDLRPERQAAVMVKR
ncbi:MAG: FtsQ-type POTRA domain-containing protein [Nitrospirota bacterium]